MMALNENLKGEDEKEFERIQAAREDTMNLLRSAYTLKQLIQHQQFGLRQIAYDIGQFERRKLLYFSQSSMPTHKVILQANQVFFSGSKLAKNILEKSCAECGLHLATQKSNTTSLDDRWIQLRESGLSIFDFSGFNPSISDPKEWKQGGKEIEIDALQAASQTAITAFECGWALALGKPMVILLKAGQTPPFDIDVHPCFLHDDEDDVHRLIAAILIAMYGKPRLSKENLLPISSEYLKLIATSLPAEKTKDILQVIEATSDDAMLLKLAGKSLLKLNPGEKHMIFFPPFAGSYPSSTGRKQLFHVTAFRAWSKDTENTLKSVCAELDMDYRVGYDSLDPEIMPAIWKDLTASHFILADITLLNPNASLELAVAMALGKPTLIIHQHEFIQRFFPPLLKTRTHTYDSVNASVDFRMLLKSFLTGK
jgi:nucleoside 2-deoxyribosyltransferase